MICKEQTPQLQASLQVLLTRPMCTVSLQATRCPQLYNARHLGINELHPLELWELLGGDLPGCSRISAFSPSEGPHKANCTSIVSNSKEIILSHTDRNILLNPTAGWLPCWPQIHPLSHPMTDACPYNLPPTSSRKH